MKPCEACRQRAEELNALLPFAAHAKLTTTATPSTSGPSPPSLAGAVVD